MSGYRLEPVINDMDWELREIKETVKVLEMNLKETTEAIAELHGVVKDIQDKYNTFVEDCIDDIANIRDYTINLGNAIEHLDTEMSNMSGAYNDNFKTIDKIIEDVDINFATIDNNFDTVDEDLNNCSGDMSTIYKLIATLIVKLYENSDIDFDTDYELIELLSLSQGYINEFGGYFDE